MRHADRHQAVVARADPERALGRVDDRDAVEHVEGLFERVDVGRHRSAGLELADGEAGVDGGPLVHDRPSPESGRLGGPAARFGECGLGCPGHQVPARHAAGTFALAAASTSRSRAVSTRPRARSTSATMRPSRFLTTPSTITVSMLLTSAHRTTAATGSITGVTLMSRASITTTSARLPGVREPVRSSTPAT